ncbi:MAG TPA: arginine repressor [Acidimicrobiales bacterium]|nr:arginine repressor [Acidimicrobiales bacterium]
MTKTGRQRRIVELLQTQRVTSQTMLVELLGSNGASATQATVSRDLEELGAVKVRVPGGEPVYAIPERAHHQVAPPDQLRRVLGEWVAEVNASANLVVVKTPPGSAHVVGSAIDRAGLEGVLGTVAGDDTILVITASANGGTKVARKLSELAGLSKEPQNA